MPLPAAQRAPERRRSAGASTAPPSSGRRGLPESVGSGGVGRPPSRPPPSGGGRAPAEAALGQRPARRGASA
eukprot:11216902-Lingulodinium_polyedra.AAC.1